MLDVKSLVVSLPVSHPPLQVAHAPEQSAGWRARAAHRPRTVLGTAPTELTITVNGTSASRQGNLFTALLAGDDKKDEPDWPQSAITDGASSLF